jgi:hypothetical protein
MICSHLCFSTPGQPLPANAAVASWAVEGSSFVWRVAVCRNVWNRTAPEVWQLLLLLLDPQPRVAALQVAPAAWGWRGLRGFGSAAAAAVWINVQQQQQ